MSSSKEQHRCRKSRRIDSSEVNVMRKFSVWLLVIALIAGCLTGCNKNEPTPPEPSEPSGGETQNSANESTEDPNIWTAEGYWVAETWDHPDADGPEALNPEVWMLDLWVRADGTARFRGIYEGVCLLSDDHLNLTWERTAQGEILFYSSSNIAPVITGTFSEGVLSLNYLGGTLGMKQTAEPETAGQLYSPAELEGTWLMVSGETEGYEWEAMPDRLSSLVFSVTFFDDPPSLAAHREVRDYDGELTDSAYNVKVDVLPEPLYEGCENADWSVRIGPASEVDENGYPLGTEYYATLLNHNTMLVQQYFTLDGAPTVTYQTYARFPDRLSWQSPEAMTLDLSTWTITEYVSMSGEDLAVPEKLEGMRICLLDNSDCWIQFGDGHIEEGTWLLETGGVLLLRSDEEWGSNFWFGGAISSLSKEEAYGYTTAYQMALYYEGGILKLELESYG